MRRRPVTSRIDILTNPDGSPRVAAGERIGLNLFDDADFVLTITDATEQPGGGRAWAGTLDGIDHGYAVVALHGGALVGSVVMPGAVYRIGYTPSGTPVIEQIDQSRLPPEAEPVTAPLSDAQIPPAAADTAAQIDVMVVYTAAARTAAGGAAAIQAEAAAAVAVANQAYTNNGLIQRLRLVHTSEVAIAESGDFVADLTGLRDNAAVAALRDASAADLVTLLTSNGANPPACGIGFVMRTNSTAFAPNGYNVVDRICASANLTFPHELGHNMGAAHDPYVATANGESGLFPYSHGYVNLTGRIRTIMAYDDQCQASGFTCTRILYFSTPNQTLSGMVIGTGATSDNARTLGETADTIANFRQGFTYALSSSGDITVPQGSSGVTTITATQQGGSPPTVSFSVSGLPSGTTASFSSTECTPSCSTQLTITVSPSAAPGTFPITVTGTPQQRSTTFNLVVPVAFDYALTNSRGITVPQGASDATTIAAALQGGSTQVVSFEVSGLPAGVTTAFSLGACAPTCATTLTLSTSSITPVGTFPITVTGTPIGRTTTFTLVVAPFADGVSAFVVGLYQHALERAPDPADLAHWTDILVQRCDVTGFRDVVDGVFDSPTFRARPLTLPSLVVALYRSLLLRDPGAPELAYWASVFREGRRALAIDFTRSPEFQSLLPDRTNRSAVTIVVTRFYTEILGRAPTDREISGWVNHIVATRDVEGTIAVFVTSQEFEQQALTFRDYAATLYRSVLARTPAQGELDGWEGILRAQLLGVLNGSFIPSGEFQTRVPHICGH